jgi:hypothetical protein
MPPLASEFGGRYGLLFGCALLIALPPLGIAWIWLQVRALMTSGRLSPLALAFVFLYSVVPSFIVATSLREWRTLGRYNVLLLTLSLCGLGLVPLTLVRELLTFRSDRRARGDGRGRREKTRKRRQPEDPNGSA